MGKKENNQQEHYSSLVVIDRTVFQKTDEERVALKAMKALIKRQNSSSF